MSNYNDNWKQFLNEMYSTSATNQDGMGLTTVSAEKEFKGCKERAQHSSDNRLALQNVSEEEAIEEKEKKRDCFKNKTFSGKVRCTIRKKNISKKRASAYVASVLRDMGELDEADSYHWNEPSWHYDGGYGDPEGPDSKWYLGEEELEEKKNRKGASSSYCKKTPCKDMGFTQKASCKSQGIKDCYRGKKNESKEKKSKIDLMLPRGKKVVLKAEDKDYDRGLVVKLLDDGGYDVYYWYENPDDIYPAEIKIDDKLITKDGKVVHIGYHPELKNERKDPKVGTGKKPKGSGRRLYTDEDPSDTVSVEFSSVAAIKRTLAKSSFKSKSHKRQSQIINLIHQRARAAYKNAKDPKVKARLKKAFKYAERRKEASKRKTKARQKKKNENLRRIIQEELNVVRLEKLINVSDMEYLSAGRFGSVFKATHPEYGNIALKVLSLDSGKSDSDFAGADPVKVRQEISNYENVGIAVDSNDQVAKHFPKIYDVGMKRDGDDVIGYVIMELIKPSPYSQEIINTLFSGVERIARIENEDWWTPDPIGPEGELYGKELSIDRKTENIFLHDQESVKGMIKELWDQIKTELDWTSMDEEQLSSLIQAGSEDITKITETIHGLFRNYFTNIEAISDSAIESRYNQARNVVLGASSTASSKLNNLQSIIDSDYGSRPVAKLGVMAVTAAIIEFLKRFPLKDSFDYFLPGWLQDAITYPKMFEVIPAHYYSSGLKDVREDIPEAAVSLEKSFKALKDEVGLVPRDLHSLNVMVKDDTGGIVIVDVGSFQEVKG